MSTTNFALSSLLYPCHLAQAHRAMASTVKQLPPVAETIVDHLAYCVGHLDHVIAMLRHLWPPTLEMSHAGASTI
jgi:hypothetical protein